MSNVAQTNWGHPGITGYYSDPNRLINGNGKAPLDFTNSVKLLGTYALPWLGGLNLSGIYQFDSGHTWERTFFVPVRATWSARSRAAPVGFPRPQGSTSAPTRRSGCRGAAERSVCLSTCSMSPIAACPQRSTVSRVRGSACRSGGPLREQRGSGPGGCSE